MASYDFRCWKGHVTEITQPMGDELPEVVPCVICRVGAKRVYEPPLAIHFKGPGFYETDVKSRFERKSRKRLTDDLPVPYDPVAELARRM